MNFVLEFLKVTWQFFVWAFVNLLWKPFKFVSAGIMKAMKNRKKPKFNTDDAVADAQGSAAKHLPELTKELEETNKKMSKLSAEWSTLNAKKERIESVIYVASGEFVKPRKRNNSNNKQNNNNNNNNNKQKQNNNQRNNTPSIADADFAS